MTSTYPNTLLLGAGFSFDFGMPLTFELTEILLEPFNRRSAYGLAATLSSKNPYSSERPINKKAIREAIDVVLAYKRRSGKNYEALLAEIEELGHMGGKTQSDRDSYHYVFGYLYELVYGILYAFQLDAFKELYPLNRAHFSSIRNLLGERPTWVFTLNHDLFLECLAIDEGIPITYGDTSTIVFPVSNLPQSEMLALTTSARNDLARDGTGWLTNGQGINCVRVHGGLAELEYRDETLICNPSLHWKSSDQLIKQLSNIDAMGYYHDGRKVPSSRDRVVTGPDGTLDIVCRAMLTGGRKYSKTTKPKKGEEKLNLFDEVLRDTENLVVIGYSFGDAHINNRISNAMVLNPRLTVRSVDPKGKKCPAFLEQFDYDFRVRAAYCRAAEWFTYAPEEKWDPEQTRALRDNESRRSEIGARVKANWWRPRLAEYMTRLTSA
jgi:hypothetical protein